MEEKEIKDVDLEDLSFVVPAEGWEEMALEWTKDEGDARKRAVGWCALGRWTQGHKPGSRGEMFTRARDADPGYWGWCISLRRRTLRMACAERRIWTG